MGLGYAEITQETMVEKPLLDMTEGRVECINPEADLLQQTTMPVINTDDQAATCAGCGGKIVDRYYLLAVDKQWHIHCLKCSECQLRLDSELTCFSKDGIIFCKEDYYRRFAVKRCARCHLGISANELVMRARELVYHLNCFTCASCNKALTTGDHFGMKESMVYCREHYELLLQGDYMPGMSPCSITGPLNTQVPFYNGVGAVQKGRPRKRKSPIPDPDSCSMGDRPSLSSDCKRSKSKCGSPDEVQLMYSAMWEGLGPNENNNTPLNGDYQPQPPRQKRMRTSFKHHQLRTMKSYFALNHNPDAKDLKQLAQKTGLTKRVLQVWFQNARAKYRRNLLKQQSGDGSNGNGTTGLDKDKDDHALGELSNSRSPALSDISSTPSMSDLQGSSIDGDQHDVSGSSLTELFSNSINSMS